MDSQLRKIAVLINAIIAFVTLLVVGVVSAASLQPWQFTAPLQVARHSHGMVATATHVYVLGGATSGCALLDSVEVAPIQPDGSLGPWAFTTPLTFPRAYLGAAIVGGHVYVVGGANGCGLVEANKYATVERAPILPDGSLGPWTPVAPLQFPRAHMPVVTDGTHLYTVGGYDGTRTNRVEMSTVLPDGALTPWQAVASMAAGREAPAVAIRNGVLYAAGGLGGGIYAGSEGARIQPDGTLDPWQPMAAMSAQRYQAAGASVAGDLWVAGGTPNGVAFTTVERAAIGTDGEITGWVPDSPMNLGRVGHAMAASGPWLYVSGHGDNAGIAYASVEYTGPSSGPAPEPVPVSFALAGKYASPASPIAVAVGDLNQDGRPDYAVSNTWSSSVSVFLARPEGGYAWQTELAAGLRPVGIVLADLNGDGHLDLLVANYDSDSLSLYLGNGDGTFQPRMDLAPGRGPGNPVVADVNRDGIPDIVVENWHANTVSVLRGLPGGGFAPRTESATGSGPIGPVLGDLNGDGKLDLVVPNFTASSVSVLLGNGDGTFGPHMDYPVGNNPTSAAIGDFNGDGKLDVAVSNVYSHSVSVLLGSGDGTLGDRTDYATAIYPWDVLAADFNGDGRMDLAVTSHDAAVVSIFVGLGNGAFLPKVDFISGGGPAHAAVADLNGDGKPDLLVPNLYENTVSVLLNTTPYTVNIPPQASAGSDRAVRLGSLVTLDGSGSIDPDNGPSPLTYLWTQTVGPDVILGGGGPTSMNPTFTPTVPGSYAFQLVVNDGQANSAPATVTIAVPLLGDVDGDGDVDSADLNLILAARNTPSSSVNDLRDLNGDMKIDALDSRILTTLCTRPRCATQ